MEFIVRGSWMNLVKAGLGLGFDVLRLLAIIFAIVYVVVNWFQKKIKRADLSLLFLFLIEESNMKKLILFALVYLLCFRDDLIIKFWCVMSVKKISSLMKMILDDFFNLKSRREEREKKHPLGAFLGLPKGSPILYLILCD